MIGLGERLALQAALMPPHRYPITVAAAVVLLRSPSPSAQDWEAAAARKTIRLRFISPPPATSLPNGEHSDAALWTILAKAWRAKAVWGSRVIKQPELR